MGLLRKPKAQTVMASAPEEDETEEEIKHIEDLNDTEDVVGIKTKVKPKSKTEPAPSAQSPQPEGYPVCMSQVQINNIVIENNYLLKHIISQMEE